MNTPEQDCLERTRLYALPGQPSGVQLWATQLVALVGVEDHPTIANGFRRAALELNGTHILAIFNEIIEYDQRPLLLQVMAPTMLVRGMCDGFVPEYCVEEIHRLIPHSSVIRLQDAGHLPYLEQPVVINDYLARFLGQREPPRLTLPTTKMAVSQ